MTAIYPAQPAVKNFLHAVKKMKYYMEIKAYMSFYSGLPDHIGPRTTFAFGDAKSIAAVQHTLTFSEKASHRLNPQWRPAYSLPALQGPEQ